MLLPANGSGCTEPFVYVEEESMVEIIEERALRLRRGDSVETRDRVAGIVIHTTGIGPAKRFHRQAAKNGWRTHFDAAVYLYTRIMTAGPHYVVGQDGEIARVMPEEMVAYGAAARHPWQYRLPNGRWRKKRPWWHERWLPLGIDRPALLGQPDFRLYDTRGRINPRAIHIEVVPPAGNKRGEWSDSTWRSLAWLVGGVCERWSIPLDETCVVSHADLCPVERGRPRIPWDPWPEQWSGPESVARIRSLLDTAEPEC